MNKARTTIVFLHRLLQCFSMLQTKQRNYHTPADAYCNNELSAVETRLDYIPTNILACSTFEANHH